MVYIDGLYADLDLVPCSLCGTPIGLTKTRLRKMGEGNRPTCTTCRSRQRPDRPTAPRTTLPVPGPDLGPHVLTGATCRICESEGAVEGKNGLCPRCHELPLCACCEGIRGGCEHCRPRHYGFILRSAEAQQARRRDEQKQAWRDANPDRGTIAARAAARERAATSRRLANLKRRWS